MEDTNVAVKAIEESAATDESNEVLSPAVEEAEESAAEESAEDEGAEESEEDEGEPVGE
jgi:hypothetical protein